MNNNESDLINMTPIEKHPNLLHARDIKEVCTPLKQLGIVYFSHVVIDDKDRFSSIGMSPEFAKLYCEKKYYNHDIHQAKFSNQLPYIIWDNIPKDNKMADLYADFNDLSLGHTFTIIQHNNGHKHYYHFSAKLGNHGINSVYLQNFDFLKTFILYFSEQVNAEKHLKQAYDIKFSVEQPVENVICKTSNLSLSINRTYVGPHTYLTPREMECLHWLSQGMTLEDAAKKLSVTTRTMKAHIANIKNKLNCKNLFQLGIAYEGI